MRDICPESCGICTKDHKWKRQDQEVACHALTTLLDKNDIVRVGYMAVDMEGAEMNFLKTFNFAHYHVDLLQVRYRVTLYATLQPCTLPCNLVRYLATLHF